MGSIDEEVDVAIEVSTDGQVAPSHADYARERLGPLVEKVPEPVLFARVRLTQSGDPANERPSAVRMELDVDGHVFHAHAEQPTMAEAIDLVHDRVASQLAHDRSRRQAQRHAAADRTG